MYERKVNFNDFKQECEKFYWGFKNNGRTEFGDLRVYESLPCDQSQKLFPKQWHPKYWFIFQYEYHRHFILTCNADTGFCEVYADRYVVLFDDGLGFETPIKGLTQKLDFGYDLDSALGRICFWLPILEMRRGDIFRNDTFFMDSNHTEQFKNGDHPLEQDYPDMSFIYALDKLIEAKRSGSREWRGMQMYLSCGGWLGHPDFVVNL